VLRGAVVRKPSKQDNDPFSFSAAGVWPCGWAMRVCVFKNLFDK
jgi:hypothetical protein